MLKFFKIFCFIAIVTSLAMLSSCDSNVNDGDDSIIDDSGNHETGDKENMNTSTHYESTSKIAFITKSDALHEEVSEKLSTALTESIIKNGFVYNGTLSHENENEVIVGYVPERAISCKAYDILSNLKIESDITDSRYVVYAENGQIAIICDKNEHTTVQTLDAIVERFINEYIKNKNELDLENGIVMSGILDLYVEQKKFDDIETEQRWNKVEETIGDRDIYLAFRNFFEECFGDEIVDLIANLYDPATGLFYASMSGKRAEGIYPIPEATSVILGHMVNTGMLRHVGGKYYLTDLMKHKIIYYVKSIQGTDGEFYVSQIKKEKIDSNRLGRDRGACTGLLDRFGVAPTYSVGKFVGDGVSAEEYWANLVKEGIVTEEDKPIIYYAEDRNALAAHSFASSTVEAVSKVVTVSTTQFQSHENFIKWLLEKDPYNNPYSSMSNTSSAASIISDWSSKLGGYTGENTVVNHVSKSFDLYKGETLKDILIRWMNSHINAVGLFGKITNNYDENGNPIYDGFFGGWGYQNSNGFLKAIGRYNDMKISFPKSRLAAESLLRGINSDEPVTNNILDIFNVWSSLNSLKNNIKNYYEGADKSELLSLIDDTLRKQIVIDEKTGETKAYGAIAIEKCTNKLLTFKKSDGGFGHSVSSGTTNWQGGLKVGIGSDNLSDIDAIACSTVYLGNAMSTLFGLSFVADVPMNTDSDLLRFLEIIGKQEKVVKIGPDGELPTNK